MIIFDINNITKKSDLINNDSLSSYLGFAAQQNHNVYETFYSFLSEEKPSRILEIGTALGGLTGFLDYCCKLLNISCNIRSYDIHYNSWYEDLKNSGIDIRIENIFMDNYNNIPLEVIEYIQSPGTTIILCDGGSKTNEFNILSKYIKYDDIIMTHDYAPNIEYFNSYMKNNIWNWLEIQDSDILDAINTNNLIKYKYEEFLSCAWLCCKKIKSQD